MRGALAIRKPTATLAIDTSGTNITTSAYVQLTASLSAPCSMIEVFNQSGSLIKLAIGASGHEVDIPYTIPSGGSNQLLTIEIAKGVRLSAKAVDANQTTGYLVINCFG